MTSLSANGKLFLSVEKEENAILWDTHTRKQLSIFKDAMAATFTKNNTILLVDKNYIMKEITVDGKIITSYTLTSNGDDKNNRSGLMMIPDAEILIVNSKVYKNNVGYLGRLKVEDVAGYPCDYSVKTGKYLMCWEQNIYLYDNPQSAPVKTMSGVIENGRLTAAYFLPDGEKIIVFTEQGKISIVDINSGLIQKDVKLTSLTSEGIVAYNNQLLMKTDFGYKQIHPSGGLFTFVNFNPGNFITDVNTERKSIQLTNIIEKKNIVFQGASEDFLNRQYLNEISGLFVTSHQNHFLLWDLKAGYLKSATPSTADILPFHRSKRVVSYKADVSLLDSAGKKTRTYDRSERINRTLSVSTSFDEKYLLHNYDYEFNGPERDLPHALLEVFDVNTGKRILRKDKVSSAVFGNSKNIMATAFEFDNQAPLSFYDIPSGKLLSHVTIPGGAAFTGGLFFSANDKYLTFTTANGIYQIEISKNSVKEIKINERINGQSAITSNDENLYIAGTYNGDIIFYDLKNDKYLPEKKIQAGSRQISGLSITQDDKYIFSNSPENFIKLWRLRDGELLATLYPNNETGDWAVITPDGRFDASPGAQEDMYYVKGVNTYPLSRLSEKFYTPRLLPRLLNGEQFEKIDIDIDFIKPKPRARILYAEAKHNLEVSDDKPSYSNTSGIAEITVNATAPDDKVDEIRLFHNGKAVNLATRGLFVTDNNGSESKKYTINLLPGANTFRAVALNSQRTESEPDEIVVNYKNGDAPAPKPNNNTNNSVAIDEIDRNATLHIVVIGINAYKNKINPLTYALPDATAFKEELEKDAKSMVNNVKSYLITDDAASKTGIIAAFDNIKKTAKPEDVFVFYYAGHGYIHPTNNEFYLVSSDVADGGESLLKNGVSAKELQTFAVDIPAQKQLFIMDACQSAGAFEKMLKHDGEQQKALAVVSRSTGTHWMAASGSTETAKEFGELGHGVFTYSLLEALKGKAVNNKMITVNGLKTYLQQIVPELVKKYGGNSQYPASYGFGNDFPVEILK